MFQVVFFVIAGIAAVFSLLVVCIYNFNRRALEEERREDANDKSRIFHRRY